MTIYWLTSTAGSSSRLYREYGDLLADPERNVAPTAVAVFPATAPSGRWPRVTTTW